MVVLGMANLHLSNNPVANVYWLLGLMHRLNKVAAMSAKQSYAGLAIAHRCLPLQTLDEFAVTARSHKTARVDAFHRSPSLQRACYVAPA